MEKADLIDMLDEISIIYPQFKFMGEPIDSQKKILEVWFKRMKDCDAKSVKKRLDEYIASGNRFAPSIGELYVSPDPFGPEYQAKQRAYFEEIDKPKTSEELEELERVKREYMERFFSNNRK